MKKERRQNARYSVVDDAYAALGRNYAKVGKIIDISLGGLSFEYIHSDITYQNEETIDIFIENTPFGLYNIACTLVYDKIVKTPSVKDEFMDRTATRRCGIKFHRLGKDEAKQLRKFISVHTEKFAK
jgi:hypothetical protein